MNRHTSWQRLVAVVGVALLVAVMGSGSSDALADPKGFVFTPLLFLGDPTPGGETFLDVFDSSRINNRGDILFGSNVTADEEGGIFLLSRGEMSQIPARAGEPAPGGGVFSLGTLLPTTFNDAGDTGFVWLLEPFPVARRSPGTLGVFSPVSRRGFAAGISAVEACGLTGSSSEPDEEPGLRSHRSSGNK